jgi:hypothetical protein
VAAGPSLAATLPYPHRPPLPGRVRAAPYRDRVAAGRPRARVCLPRPRSCPSLPAAPPGLHAARPLRRLTPWPGLRAHVCPRRGRQGPDHATSWPPGLGPSPPGSRRVCSTPATRGVCAAPRPTMPRPPACRHAGPLPLPQRAALPRRPLPTTAGQARRPLLSIRAPVQRPS